MNLRKGFRRVALILSLMPVLIGIVVFVVGLDDNDEDECIAGILIALVGFPTIWTIYGTVLYIINGFNTKCCANCEKNMGKLEETYAFKGQLVCPECYKRLADTSEEKRD